MNRTKRNRAEWLELALQQRASGLTMKAWCAENGINIYTMADRLTRLRKDGLLEKAKTVRKVRPNPEPKWVEISSHPPQPMVEICVKIGSCEIVVPPGFDEGSFARVCKVLVSLC